MSSLNPPSRYSLVHDPWIPTRHGDVSLETTLRDSRSIAGIDSGNAAVDVAVMRFILALVYRAHALYGPDTTDIDDALDAWERVWNSDTLYTDEVARYLDEYGESMTLETLLVPSMVSASGVWRETDTMFQSRDLFPQVVPETMTPAELARAVLYVQAWDTAGIKTGDPTDPRTTGGKIYGATVGGLGWAGTTAIIGATLHETLCLNWVPGLASTGDLPMWERAHYGACARSDIEPGHTPGVVELLTWQSRRLNAQWEDGVCTGVMVSAGDNLPIDAYTNDPMTVFTLSEPRSKTTGRPVYVPAPMYSHNAVWRCVGGLLPSTPRETVSSGVAEGSVKSLPPKTAEFLGSAIDEGVLADGFVLRAHHVSYVYGTKSVVIDDVRETTFPLPSASLGTGQCAATVVAAADYTAEKVMKAIRSFVWSLDIAAGGEGAWDSASITAMMDKFTRAVSASFNAWSETVTQGGVDDLDRWKQQVKDDVVRVAEKCVSLAPVRASVGTIHDGRTYSAARSLDALRTSLTPKKDTNE